ncbi:MAG: hypothetical protein IJF97_00750 [Eggerthellaceae bacterium]|nr:hypothetical protein [Eggerthellaceae bacterium]MBQ3342679.1 hypothetical protein [Kiritimatiellia bacterium]
MISSCGHDERNKYYGGVAGDQSGTEWYVRKWYKGGWDEVFVHPDRAVREAIAKVSKQGALNPNIGYDQYQRLTFYDQLKKANWDASKIAVPCEADCSSSTAACVIAAGHIIGVPRIYNNVSEYAVTWNIGKMLVNAGFSRLTDAKYLTSDAYLPAGTIVNRSSQHVVITVSDGANAAETVRLVGGYDSEGDEVNDSDIKKIKDAVSSTVPKATWDYVIDGKKAATRVKESSDEATATDDPSGRKVKMNDHDHIKWIASKQAKMDAKLDRILEILGEDDA